MYTPALLNYLRCLQVVDPNRPTFGFDCVRYGLDTVEASPMMYGVDGLSDWRAYCSVFSRSIDREARRQRLIDLRGLPSLWG